MKKKFTFLIAALALLTMINLPGKAVGQQKQTVEYKLTISSSDFNSTSYPANNNEKTSYAVCTSDNTKQFEVKWTSYQVMLGTGSNAGTMQWQKNAGKIYNSTNLGTITSVTVTSTVGTYTTYYGTSEQPSYGAAGNGKGYFKTSVGGATGYSSKVEVVFEVEEGGASTYTLTYNRNGANSGNVPVDNTAYDATNNIVTVVGNTGNLAKEHYSFGGWNTKADGTGTNYVAGDTFTIEASITLYAKWNPITHTAAFSVNGTTTTQDFAEGATITFPANPADIGNKTFVGWVTTAIEGTTNTTPEFVNTATTTMGNSNVTYYAVFAFADASGAPVETKTQTLEYDTWTYGGSTTDKSSYRLFHNGGYVESAAFDLSKLSKVIVYGGTFGGNSYNSLTIGDGTNTWKNVTVSGASQTGENTYTEGTALTGTNPLRVTSTCGSTSGNGSGIRMSKVEIFTLEPSIVYSNYCTTVLYDVATPTFSPAGGTYTDPQNVTITCTTDDATIQYKLTENGEWQNYNGAISVSTTTTIWAKATKTGMDDSQVATATYTIKPYVVIYNSNGVEEMVYQESPIFSLAAPSNVPTDFTFVGWTMYETDLDVDVTLGGETFNLTDYNTDNASLYAVFSGEVGAIPAIPATPARFEKVTENLEDWSGTYLIVHEGNNTNPQPKAFNGNLSNLDATPNTINVTISSGTITATDDLIAAMFTIAQNSGVENYPYTIKSANDLYIGNTSGSNGFNQSETVKYGNAIAYNSSKIEITGSGSTRLQFNQNADNSKFRYYASNQNAIQLYKYIEGTPGVPGVAGTTARFIRVFQNETAEDIVFILGPSIIPSGYYLNMGDNVIDSRNADMFIIEDGGQLITSTSDVHATVQKSIRAYSSATGAGNTDGWYFIASPVISTTPAAVSNLISNTYDFYRLNSETGKWENSKNPAHSDDFQTIYFSEGFLYANSNNVTLAFSGEIWPYTEPELKSVEPGFNLIGNPFTFNAYIDRPYYKLNGGTAIISVNDNSPIAPCTGVIVEGSENDNVTFSMTAPSQNAGNHGNVQMVLTQTATTRGESNVETLDKAIVSFNEGSRLEKFYFGTQNANIYLPQGNKEYAIVSAGAQGEMPVNFKANQSGEYTISVNTTEVEMTYLHLIDNMTGADINLLATPSYTFNARNDDYASRFRLVFSANSNNENGNDNFAFISDGQIILTEQGNVQVYDVMGRMISSHNNVNHFAAEGMAAGVYVIRLTNGNDVKTQKIVVK